MFLRLESLNNLVFKTGQVFSMDLAKNFLELALAMWLLTMLLILGSKNYIYYFLSDLWSGQVNLSLETHSHFFLNFLDYVSVLFFNFCLCACSYYQKTTENRCITLQYSTGFKPIIFWKISLIQLLDKSNNTSIAIEDSF